MSLERGRPDHLGPHGLGKGFGSYSKYIWQLLEGFKGHTLFNCFKQKRILAALCRKEFREAQEELGTLGQRS